MIVPYWQSVYWRVGEALRLGQSAFTPSDLRGGKSCFHVAKHFRLTMDQYGMFRTGVGTYAAIEAHIVRKQLAVKQYWAGEFPSGIPVLNPHEAKQLRDKRARLRLAADEARKTA